VSRRPEGYPQDVSVRTAGPEDVDSIFEIKRAASLAAYSHVFPPEEYPFPNEDVRDEVNAMMADENARALIAEKDGRAVGFIALIDAQVVSLFVAPEESGQGIGTMLHDAAISPLAESGRGSLQLWVLEENRVARRFYERLGWRTDGRRRTSPYPPRPPVVGYSLDLGAFPAAGDPRRLSGDP
jgi:ribosomal protein S18 acetylase RimI-like enzyme